MTIQDVMDNVKAGNYDTKLPYPKQPEGYKNENYVYDEDKSVKWNKEHRIELIDLYRAAQVAYRKDSYNLQSKFEDDLIKAIMHDYDLSDKQAKIVCTRAWEDGHANGYDEVIVYAQNYGDFARDILDEKTYY